MRAGKLNSWLSLYGAEPERDDWGHPGGARPFLGNLWGDVRNPTGKAVLRAGGVQQAVGCSVRVRLADAMLYEVAPGMVIDTQVSRYEVEAVLPDEQDRDHMDLVCKQVRE